MKALVRTCAAGIALLALGAGSAQAVITQSNITAPADPYFALFDQDAVVPATVTVSGTSNGSTGDTVDIVCWHDGFGELVADDVPVNADGSFETAAPAGVLAFNTCHLKAIPDSSAQQAASRFKGPRMAVSDYRVSGEVAGGPNDGLVYDYEVTANGLRGYWNLWSLSGFGISRGSPYALPAFDDEAASWDDGALVDAFDDDGLRSSMVVDGNGAFGPTAAANLFVGASDNAGLQPTSFSVTQNVQTGDVTVTESAALVKCPTNTLPPDAVNCSSFQPVGVTWERTHVVREGGRQDAVTERLVSTDSAQHSVDVLVWNDFDEGETGWRFPPHPSEPSRFGRGDLTTKAEMPAVPFTLIADESDDEPGDSLEAGFAGLTFGTKPEELRWVAEDRFEAQYLVTVPAGGSVQLRHAYSQAFTQPGVQELGRRAEYRWSSPNTRISLKPRKRTPLRTASFRFASTHLNSTFRCKLDRRPYRPCAPRTTYRRLVRGPHRLLVRAVNQFGNVDPTPASYTWRITRP